MSEQGFAVYAQVGNQKVRVGTAYKDGDGFTLAFGGLSIGGVPDSTGQAPSTQRRAPSGDSGAVFPPFGRSKGAPIRGAAMGDLTFYANAARRSLADEAKQRWWPKEQALLDAINAEMARQGGGEPEPRGRDVSPENEDDLPF